MGDELDITEALASPRRGGLFLAMLTICVAVVYLTRDYSPVPGPPLQKVLQAREEPPPPKHENEVLMLEPGYRLATEAEVERALFGRGWEHDGPLDVYDMPKDRRLLIVVNPRGRFVRRFVPLNVDVYDLSGSSSEGGAP